MRLILRTSLPAGEHTAWRQALAQAVAERLPEARWVDDEPPGSGAPPALQADVALVANPAPGSLRHVTGLRLIQSLWAGVDRLLQDDTLPPHVPVARMVDPAMTAAMVETALWAVIALHRGFFVYAQRQQLAHWHAHAQRRADEVRVLVLGLGEMGAAVATALAGRGYRVTGWRRSPEGAVPPGVGLAWGEAALAPALGAADLLVNLLPLTSQTHDLLDAHVFAALPRGASVVNLGRGAHLVEADLLEALASGQLRHAVLDVFRTEPLPAGHAFWAHPNLTVLPHAAAQTDLRTAAAVAVDNLLALKAGGPIAHRVDRDRGY